MNTIRFSHNWGNKLSHEIFTTIRKYIEDKYFYYFDKLGREYEIVLNCHKITEATLIEVEIKQFTELPLGLLHCDTGIVSNYEIFDLFKKFGIEKEDKVIVLTFKRVE